MRKSIADLVPRRSTIYPPPFDKVTQGREKYALGDAFGLAQFGVNLVRLAPGAASALRHWHSAEDEFVYILEGEATLVTDAGEEVLYAGHFAGFKAAMPNAHQLVNKSDRDVVYIEVGGRNPSIDFVTYPDDDLAVSPAPDGKRQLTRKDGSPL